MTYGPRDDFAYGREDRQLIAWGSDAALADGVRCEPGRARLAIDLDRLGRLLASHGHLSRKLQRVTRQMRAIRGYLAQPACNVRLGGAYYGYYRAKQSALLTLLRANRLEGRALLVELGLAPGTPPGSALFAGVGPADRDVSSAREIYGRRPFGPGCSP
jgi:hypothetical protein